jgi:hypothetical protein
MINQRPLYDRYYDPLWAEAQELDIAVSFHGNHAAYAEHLARRYLDNLVLSHACGQPVEMMLALGAVVTGGVLSRFPRLRMAFLEGNCSWLPWWLWALDERWEAWGDHALFKQDAKPSDLFRRQCFVSVEPEEELAKHVVTELGDDNLVLSTDWPHDDSRYPHAIDGFLELPHLSSESKRKISYRRASYPSTQVRAGRPGEGKDGRARGRWSGRADLNGRPPAPKAGALPGCATPRRQHYPTLTGRFASPPRGCQRFATGFPAPRAAGRGAPHPAARGSAHTGSSASSAWSTSCAPASLGHPAGVFP